MVSPTGQGLNRLIGNDNTKVRKKPGPLAGQNDQSLPVSVSHQEAVSLQDEGNAQKVNLLPGAAPETNTGS